MILDESTRALAGDDLRRIHAMLRRITADGSSAVLISHNLTEIMAVTDRLTICATAEWPVPGWSLRGSARRRSRGACSAARSP